MSFSVALILKVRPEIELNIAFAILYVFVWSCQNKARCFCSFSGTATGAQFNIRRSLTQPFYRTGSYIYVVEHCHKGETSQIHEIN